MGLFNQFRSLHIYVLLWLIVPFAVILVMILGTIVYIYQNSMTQLVLERHQQLANLAAVTISQGIEGNTHVLEALSARAALQNPDSEVRKLAFGQSENALEGFNAGVVQIDAEGKITTSAPNTNLEQWETVPGVTILSQIKDAGSATFSEVVTTRDGANFILIAAPITNEAGAVSGAIIGGIDLNDPNNFIHTAIQKLTTSTSGIAFLVDRRGVVISHPESGEIGKDYSNRPYVGQALHGNRGGIIWDSPEGERLVGAEAIVSPSGWSLVVKEPWEAIIAPVRRYTFIILIFVLLALGFFFFLSWIGTRQVTAPIQQLSKNTRLLASGDSVPPVEDSHILEINHLRASFIHMATQISSYRDGLRHYVDALTRSQEEERLRIARELHDETVQNLLAVYRRMELLSVSETDLHKKKQLCTLHDMLGQTLQGVRLISQDLRPMMLDDLGFVPALQMLVRAAHEGPGAVPDVNLEVKGEATSLPSSDELALYRIVQEALNNVRKHAHATSVQVSIDYQPDMIRLAIEDDGVGFEVPSSFTELVQAGNLGLMGIQERAYAAGGTVSVHSRMEQGTEITVLIPTTNR